MAILNDLINKEGLQAFLGKVKETFVKKEAGKSLIEETKISKLDGIEEQAQKNVLTEIQVNGAKIEPEGTVVNLTAEDLSADLTDYAKRTELEAALKKAGLSEKETTTTEGMATLKDSATKGDVFKNTDDSHYYVFVGAGEPGADTNGLIDLGESVDVGDFATAKGVAAGLAPKLDKTEAESTYAKSAEMTTELEKKADKTDMEALRSQIGSIGKVKGTTTTAEMATLKDSAENGDIYQVTDDGNKLKMFVGTGQPGADENGFIDLGTEIDLSDFATVVGMEAALGACVKASDLKVATTEEIEALFAE